MTEQQLVCVVCNNVFPWKRVGPGGIPKTCSPDCARRRKNQKNIECRKRHECPDDMHGTVSGYTYYECSCDACRKAIRVYKQKWRQERKAAGE